MQIQISWLLKKPTDLDLHCLLRQGMSCSAREGLILLPHISTYIGRRAEKTDSLKNSFHSVTRLSGYPLSGPMLATHLETCTTRLHVEMANVFTATELNRPDLLSSRLFKKINFEEFKWTGYNFKGGDGVGAG